MVLSWGGQILQFLRVFRQHFILAEYFPPAMQILTSQWTKMYTYKRRVFYSDLVAVSSSLYRFKILDMPKCTAVLFCQCWHREVWVSAGMTSCTITILPGTNITGGQIVNRRYVDFNGLLPVFSYSGAMLASIERVFTGSSPASEIIADQVNPNEVWVAVSRNATSGPPPLTAGYFDIWITTARLT